jgi:hypothetical protein
LIDLFESAGLRVRRASYANGLPAMVQEIRGRLSPRRGLRHPSGGGLRIRMPHPWINRLMGVVSATEATAVGRLGLRLPFGHSTLLWAERPD